MQLDPGLPDRQKSGGQNGQQHLISPDPQHWCPAGLRPQPTPVLPVHTRLYINTVVPKVGVATLGGRETVRGGREMISRNQINVFKY